jgi:hypothetical protein
MQVARRQQNRYVAYHLAKTVLLRTLQVHAAVARHVLDAGLLATIWMSKLCDLGGVPQNVPRHFYDTIATHAILDGMVSIVIN